MKRFRYLISGLMMVLILAGLSNLVAQQATIQFLTTYTNAEVTSGLDRDDRLFQLIDVEGTENQGSILGYCRPENTGKVQKYLESTAFRGQMPGDIQFSWGTPVEKRGLPLYAVRMKQNNYEGPAQSEIKSVEVVTGKSTDDYSLLLSFSKEGAEKWARLTGGNIGKCVAIVIDDTVWSAPMVQEEIRMGKCQISGKFSMEEIQALKKQLDPMY